MSHRQQRDFKIEIHKALDNHFALAGAATLLGVVPGGFHITCLFHQRLAFAGGAHNGFDNAGQSHLLDAFQVLLLRCSKNIGAGLKPQLFRG